MSQALIRYQFVVNALHRQLQEIELNMRSEDNWFSIAPKIARKFWKQAKTLELLFVHNWSFLSEMQEESNLDISSYYAMIRGMYEAYAVLIHLFKKENDIEENIIRFRLWEIDGLKSRLNFKRGDPDLELVERLEGDKKYIEGCKDIIRQFQYFRKLNERQQTYLLDFAAWKFSSDSLCRKDQKRWQHSIKELMIAQVSKSIF